MSKGTLRIELFNTPTFFESDVKPLMNGNQRKACTADGATRRTACSSTSSESMSPQRLLAARQCDDRGRQALLMCGQSLHAGRGDERPRRWLRGERSFIRARTELVNDHVSVRRHCAVRASREELGAYGVLVIDAGLDRQVWHCGGAVAREHAGEPVLQHARPRVRGIARVVEAPRSLVRQGAVLAPEQVVGTAAGCRTHAEHCYLQHTGLPHERRDVIPGGVGRLYALDGEVEIVDLQVLGACDGVPAVGCGLHAVNGLLDIQDRDCRRRRHSLQGRLLRKGPPRAWLAYAVGARAKVARTLSLIHI
eukprot:7092840-Prymnesium_polylepis.3